MDYSVLLNAPLFKGMTSGEIKAIFTGFPHGIKKYPPGFLIAQSGESVNSIMVVIKGVVKGEMVDYAGRIIKIEDIQAPGVLAAAFLFGNNNSFPVNVTALAETELLVIDKSDFLRLLMSNDKILVNFLNIISNRSQFLSEKIKFLNFKTIKSKLAHYIIQKAGKTGVSVRLDMTQNDLAEFFGVARPSVARILGEMEEDGYIISKGKNIRILDKKRLGDLTVD